MCLCVCVCVCVCVRYKLLAKAYPYMARRLLTDPAPELRDSFEDLVLKVCDTHTQAQTLWLLSAFITRIIFCFPGPHAAQTDGE